MEQEYVNIVLKGKDKSKPRSERREIIWKVIESESKALAYLEYLTENECENDEVHYRIEAWKVS